MNKLLLSVTIIVPAIFGFMGVLGYLNIGHHTEAQFALAQDVDPNNVIALTNKGVDLAQLGKHEEAISYYDKALAIEPNAANALSGKANALSNLGKYKEAITYYDKLLVGISPNSTEGFYADVQKAKNDALNKLGK